MAKASYEQAARATLEGSAGERVAKTTRCVAKSGALVMSVRRCVTVLGMQTVSEMYSCLRSPHPGMQKHNSAQTLT